MRRLWILLSSVLCGWALACAPDRDASKIDEVLRNAVEQKRVPAVVAMIATTEGKVYDGAYNAANDAIFAIASMTKPVTSVAVMQLVEAGKVQLDGPASAYLPELAGVQVLENGNLRAPSHPVTVRHLLSHTAGFGYEFFNRDLADLVAQGKLKSFAEGGDGFLRAPILFDPGSRWEYGINTDLLGKLVEQVSGQSLDVYFRQHIFEPLEMEDSYFHVPPGKLSRLAKIYQKMEDGSLAEQPAPPMTEGGFLSGGGGLYSTADDYLKFARALLAGGTLGERRILTAASVEMMGRNQIGNLGVGKIESLMPMLISEDAMIPGQADKFGLGFALNSSAVDGGRGANTMSWMGIYNTAFWIDREKDVCAVLLMQMLPFLEDGPRQLIEDFDRAVYAWLR